MGGSTWVQEKVELGIEGELLVFLRPNSPNWYMRVWISNEGKYLQKSLKTKSKYEAIERAKVEYKQLQIKVAKEEKIFTITFGEAAAEFTLNEQERERRGVIKNSTLLKRTTYIKNIFAPHFGIDRKVNEVSDKEMVAFVDMRLRRFKNKSTMLIELSMIRQFYTTFLIKKGYVFRIPELPEIKARKGETAKRTDTFTVKEWGILYTFMREWCKAKNISRIKIPVKIYGKYDNAEKVMNEWEWEMEVHRRIIIRELILIAANTGIRLPTEILSLKWGDIKLKKGMFSGLYFKRLNEYYTLKLGRKPQDNEPVFMELYGRRKMSVLSRHSLYRIWSDLMRDCKLTRIKFELYHLRHFYINQAILNGVDLLMISKNCGNSINTITSFYEHIDLQKHNDLLLKRRNVRKELENEVEF